MLNHLITNKGHQWNPDDLSMVEGLENNNNNNNNVSCIVHFPLWWNALYKSNNNNKMNHIIYLHLNILCYVKVQLTNYSVKFKKINNIQFRIKCITLTLLTIKRVKIRSNKMHC